MTYTLPEHIVDEFIQIKEREFTDLFRIGDLANEALAAARANNESVTKEMIFSQAGRILGRGRARVDQLAALASYFPLSVREKYEILPMSHFELAMELAERNGKSAIVWEKVLNYSLDYATEHGLPPSSVTLLSAYTWSVKQEPDARGHKPMPSFEEARRIVKEQNTSEAREIYEDQPRSVVEVDEVHDLIVQIEDRVGGLPSLVDRLSFYIGKEYSGLDDVVARLYQAVTLLSEAREIMLRWDK